MSFHARVAPVLVALTMLLVPAMAEEGESSTTPDDNRGCINVVFHEVGEGLGFYAAYTTAVGVALTTDSPGDGLTAMLFIVPSLCQPGAPSDLSWLPVYVGPQGEGSSSAPVLPDAPETPGLP